MQLHLEQHRRDKNRLRFYALEMRQDLFGTWVVFRRWGRIGLSERIFCESFCSAIEAEKQMLRICRRKQTRGYAQLPNQLDLPL